MTTKVTDKGIVYPDGTEQTTAAFGSGDVEAQPPVAFEVKANANQFVESSTLEKLIFGRVQLDTDNAFDTATNSYIVPKDGIMQINAGALLISENGYVNNCFLYLYKNDAEVLHSHVNNKVNIEKPNDALNLNSVLEVKQGDVIDIRMQITGTDNLRNSTHMSYFSGHMVSSVTDGGSGGGDIDTYTKAEIDTQQLTQDEAIQANAEAIEAIDIPEIPEPIDAYTKQEMEILLDNKANNGVSYTKEETYPNTQIDSKLFKKADKETTYTKGEVDNIIESLPEGGGGGGSDADLSAQVAQNQNDIVELEEEIEAIAPSQLRGYWVHEIEEVSLPSNSNFILKDKDYKHTNDCSKAVKLYFSFSDRDGNNVKSTLEKIEIGSMVEVFDSASDAYLLGFIEDVEMYSQCGVYSIQNISSNGNLSGTEEHAARVKFFHRDATELSTLTTGPTDYPYVAQGVGALSSRQFGVDNSSIKDAQMYFFQNLQNVHGGSQRLNKFYYPTLATELLIYHENELLMRSPIKEYRESMFSQYDVQFKIAHKTPVIHKRDAFYDLSGGTNYEVMLTNMRYIRE